jgi:hypothetical protein
MSSHTEEKGKQEEGRAEWEQEPAYKGPSNRTKRGTCKEKRDYVQDPAPKSQKKKNETQTSVTRKKKT